MRVLIVNKFFYARGGDCVVAMNTQRLLEENGHEVCVYAMSYPDNIKNEYSHLYASQINFSSSFADKVKAFKRILGKGDIVKSFNRVLSEFNPDVVHLHNIHSYLSPVVAELAKKFGAKVVWTLHDYKLICPAYACRLPNGDNCELCVTGNLSVIKHRCMKGSTLQSFIADVEARYWNKHRLIPCADTFIMPSNFMHTMMHKAGYPEKKLITLCNFIDPIKLQTILNIGINSEREDYFCYIGRLSVEKGVESLLEAAHRANIKLKIAGNGPLKEQLQAKYASNKNICFLGHLAPEDTAKLLINAKCSIMPSVCYENNPLGVIESLCAGTPVIGANIGGIPELIDSDSGQTYTSGNIEELTELMQRFNSNEFDNTSISSASIERFSPQSHYKKLLKIYTNG